MSEARQARGIHEPYRRRRIAELIGKRYLPPGGDILPSVEEIILAAYPSTDAYWRPVLYPPTSFIDAVENVAQIAAKSLAEAEEVAKHLRSMLEIYPGDMINDDARAIVSWLAGHPDAEEWLPHCLVEYLSRATPTTSSSACQPPRKRNRYASPAVRRVLKAILGDGLALVRAMTANARVEKYGASEKDTSIAYTLLRKPNAERDRLIAGN